MKEKELKEWVNTFSEQECLILINELIPQSYWMLNHFAKEQPEVFYIDDRVMIKNRRKIYAVVNRLAEIRRNE